MAITIGAFLGDQAGGAAKVVREQLERRAVVFLDKFDIDNGPFHPCERQQRINLMSIRT